MRRALSIATSSPGISSLLEEDICSIMQKPTGSKSAAESQSTREKENSTAWLLIIFLVPVTLMLHNFWAVKDPMLAQMQLAMFMKNLSMLGGALLISQFGAGPLSLDARHGR